MRKSLWIAALAAAVFAGGAAAQTASRADAQVRAQAAASTPAAAAGVRADVGATARTEARPDAAEANPTCLKQTGSRVSSRGSRDCAGYGRSYDRKDLQRTGETDVGEALRKLDPRLH